MAAILTISGAHGVGKSTLCELLAARTGFAASPERHPNPFPEDTYNGLLYFIASYSHRDSLIRANPRNWILDRWSYRDIAVYIDGLYALNRLSSSQQRTLKIVKREVLYNTLEPTIAVMLLDSTPAVMERLIKRGGKAGHLFEFDRDLMSVLNQMFREEFQDARHSGWEPARATIQPQIRIVDVCGRPVNEVAAEVISCTRVSVGVAIGC